MKIFLILPLCGILLGSKATCQNKDIELLHSIHQNRNTHLDPAMEFLSHSTVVPVVGVPVAVTCIGLLQKEKRLTNQGITMLASQFSTEVITYTVKRVINRPRPYETFEFDPLTLVHNPSFPSGHSGHAFSLATSLSLNFPKWYVIVPSYVWASSVAYSRMHLGVHYPSDVGIGCAIGSGTAYLTYFINKKLQQQKLKKTEGEKSSKDF